ncbi:MAG: hypothetical protein WBL44_05365 [Nitrososphaeraceae archaeon]
MLLLLSPNLYPVYYGSDDVGGKLRCWGPWSVDGGAAVVPKIEEGVGTFYWVVRQEDLHFNFLFVTSSRVTKS